MKAKKQYHPPVGILVGLEMTDILTASPTDLEKDPFALDRVWEGI